MSIIRDDLRAACELALTGRIAAVDELVGMQRSNLNYSRSEWAAAKERVKPTADARGGAGNSERVLSSSRPEGMDGNEDDEKAL